MAINKVEYGSDVLIDLTADTVDKTSLLKGATAHDMKGEPIIGTLDIDDVVRFKNTETEACFIPDLPLVPFVNDMLRGMLVGDDSNKGIFFREFSSSEDLNLQNKTTNFDLDIPDEVEWLVIFPLVGDVGAGYSLTGGVYIPDVFNGVDRTSYNTTAPASLACRNDTNSYISKIQNGVLSITVGNRAFWIKADVSYGIIGKEKMNG